MSDDAARVPDAASAASAPSSPPELAVESPRGRARGRTLGIVLALLVVGTWLAAGLYGLSRSREALTPVRELRPDLHAERSGGGVFSYAVRAGDAILLFDAGAAPGGRAVSLLLEAKHSDLAHVAGLWATSARPDHLGGASAFPTLPVFLGDADRAVAFGARSLPSLVDHLFRLVWSSWTLAAPLREGRTRPALAGPWTFAEGDKTHVLRAFATPGPTPGSVSYLYDDVLFVGDLLAWRDGKLAWPPHALDADPPTTRRSLTRLVEAVAPFSLAMICTGHGGCTPEGQAAPALQQLRGTASP